MKYEIKKVIDGILTYMNNEIYSGFNVWQEILARVIAGRVISNEEAFVQKITNNGFIRTFGIIDSSGMVDVDGLAKDLKKEIAKKEKISFEVPLVGPMTFVPNDVNILYKTITGTELYDENN